MSRQESENLSELAGGKSPSVWNKLRRAVEGYVREVTSEGEITWGSFTRELLSVARYQGYQEPLDVETILKNVVLSASGVTDEHFQKAEPMLEALTEKGALRREDVEDPSSPVGYFSYYYINHDERLGYDPTIKRLEKVRDENRLSI